MPSDSTGLRRLRTSYRVVYRLDVRSVLAEQAPLRLRHICAGFPPVCIRVTHALRCAMSPDPRYTPPGRALPARYGNAPWIHDPDTADGNPAGYHSVHREIDGAD